MSDQPEIFAPTKEFFQGVIQSCRREQQVLQANVLKQEGVIAFCESILKKIDEEK